MCKLKITTEAHDGTEGRSKNVQISRWKGMIKIAIKAHDNRMKNEKRSENV